MTLDKTSETAHQWLVSVLQRLGIEAEVLFEAPPICAEKLNGFGGTWMTIQTDGLSDAAISHLIGDQGRNLDALQMLLNATMNLDEPEETRLTFTLEANNFRAKRYTELVDLASHAAHQVRETQNEFEMPTDLSAAERRLVHTVLVEDTDLETFSRGQDRDRRLVVSPAKAAS